MLSIHKLDLHVLAILFLVSVVFIQQSNAECPNLQACTLDSDCPGAKYCLGPTGAKICLYCACNHRDECYRVGNSAACNCSNSAGYYGDYCECAPESSDCGVDNWALYKDCSEFYQNEFDTIENLDAVVGNELVIAYNMETQYDDCKGQCQARSCRFFSFGNYICKVFSETIAIDASSLMKNVKYAADVNFYMRQCAVC
ncbi:uncharacterized protein LOC132719846 [Ruditapes philippinarum]|uniref:uncharacterized protein LOC132719846 n=1 Tax=Ruditapes philippinarum TaxID=129788 RepID=UPI00295B73A4|nr:uncharacterized protein LOC132719846 [Ruditapes philippinarum]